MGADGDRLVTVFLCGDVMTGRGTDQILPHPGDPRIFEPLMTDARGYVALAEELNGPIPGPLDVAYIWGDALAEWRRVAPAARIVNLETSVTRSGQALPKGINYRMHPDNAGCLTAAGIDVCVLANNHVLDYGYAGLVETLDTLHRVGLQTAGAGRMREEARRPAVCGVAAGARVVTYGLGTTSSGVPASWAARDELPGVDFLGDLSDDTATAVVKRIEAARRDGDVTIVSIHWGSNWGYDVPPGHVRFARRLIDGGADVVHGHSSHHPRPIATYRNRLVLYGCGDFINDYEGIRGRDEFRGDLGLMYFATLDRLSGELVELRMTPMQVRQLRLRRAAPPDARWLADTLTRVSSPFGSAIEVDEAGRLHLRVS